MRTCGECRWWECKADAIGECYATPGESKPFMVETHPACVFWKSRRDWCTETCGTCNYLIDPECRHSPAQSVHPEWDSAGAACSKWMPKEDE